MWLSVASWGFPSCVRRGDAMGQKAPRRRMPDLLLEIGTEELPPFDIAPALGQLATRVRTALNDLRLEVGDVQTIGTPRRLACLCSGVPLRQPPAVREGRGPAAQVAFEAGGRPAPSAGRVFRRLAMPEAGLLAGIDSSQPETAAGRHRERSSLAS